MFSVHSFIIVTLIVILIMVTIDLVAKQQNTAFAAVDGDRPSAATERFLAIQKLKRKTPLDHYRIGVLHDHNYRDRIRAEEHYRLALAGILDAKDANQGERLIVDRLHDRLRMRADNDRVFEPLAFQLQVMADHARNTIAARPIAVPKQDILAAKVEWTGDTQNVHDSVMNDEMARQYFQLKKENTKPLLGIAEITHQIAIFNFGESQADKIAKHRAMQMLEYLSRYDGAVTKFNGGRESDMLGLVWNRVQNNREQTNAFITALSDAYNDGSPVCVTGRITRILSCLAHSNGTLGIMKTREAIRNEVFQKCHQILEQNLQSAGEEFRKKYNDPKQQDAPDVLQFIDKIRGEMMTLVDAQCAHMTQVERQKIKDEAAAAL